MCADHLKFNFSTWKRPEGPPHIWRVIEGRRKLENGEIPRFSIQEVPKEMENEVIKFMSTSFLLEEPFCSNIGIADDPLALQEFQATWRHNMQQGIAVVALKVQSDPAAKPVIAGANVLHVVTVEDATDAGNVTQYQSNGMKQLMRMMNELAEEADVLRRYGVDKCFSALGLSVDPSFRGQGLGEELLRMRETIGRTYQIAVCETVFSSRPAQILANRLGYKVLIEKKMCEVLDEEGEVAFPGLTGFVQFTGKRLY